MSPWLVKELRVVLCPDQVSLVPVQRTLGWRGLRQNLQAPTVLPCPGADGEPPWRAALRTLEAALPRLALGPAAATVVLSNQFLRYAVVPWQAGLSSGDEELAHARHCFVRVYGKAALQWDIRLSPLPTDGPRLASAVDAELPPALRAVLAGAGLRLRSLQPHLMRAFNRVRAGLPPHSAWFALLEPGHLCLVLLSQGRWARVSSLRIDGDWPTELPLILARQAYLAELPSLPQAVYLWDATGDDTPLPSDGPWQFHRLALPLAGGDAPGPAAPLSLVMAG